MHIENSFFDNIMHTIMNVQEKTKDSKKLRLTYLLFVQGLSYISKAIEKITLLNFNCYKMQRWLLFNLVASEVKFSDRYIVNLSRCVQRSQKFSKMKSHGCLVFMQLLLPSALRSYFQQMSMKHF